MGEGGWEKMRKGKTFSSSHLPNPTTTCRNIRSLIEVPGQSILSRRIHTLTLHLFARSSTRDFLVLRTPRSLLLVGALIERGALGPTIVQVTATACHPRPHTANQTQIVARRELGRLPSAVVGPWYVQVAQPTNRTRAPRNIAARFHSLSLRLLPRWRPRGTGRPRGAVLPKLSKVLAQFLACGGPVGFDAVAQLGHGALDV